MDLEQLAAAHTELVSAFRKMRADLIANGMLIDAMLTTMPPGARAGTATQFARMSEQFLAKQLATSQDPTDRAYEATEQAFARAKQRLGI